MHHTVCFVSLSYAIYTVGSVSHLCSSYEHTSRSYINVKPILLCYVSMHILYLFKIFDGLYDTVDLVPFFYVSLAMELALSLEKLTNEKLLHVHEVWHICI